MFLIFCFILFLGVRIGNSIPTKQILYNENNNILTWYDNFQLCQDSTNYVVTTEYECAYIAIQQNNGNAVYEWHSNTAQDVTNCYVKVFNNDGVSSSIFKTNDQKQWIYFNGNLPKNDLLQFTNDTVSECMDKCNNNNKCMYIVYSIYNSNKCWLKQSCNPVNQDIKTAWGLILNQNSVNNTQVTDFKKITKIVSGVLGSITFILLIIVIFLYFKKYIKKNLDYNKSNEFNKPNEKY